MVRRDETVARASKANERYERDARDARAAATRAETKAAKAEAEATRLREEVANYRRRLARAEDDLATARRDAEERARSRATTRPSRGASGGGGGGGGEDEELPRRCSLAIDDIEAEISALRRRVAPTRPRADAGTSAEETDAKVSGRRSIARGRRMHRPGDDGDGDGDGDVSPERAPPGTARRRIRVCRASPRGFPARRSRRVTVRVRSLLLLLRRERRTSLGRRRDVSDGGDAGSNRYLRRSRSRSGRPGPGFGPGGRPGQRPRQSRGRGRGRGRDRTDDGAATLPGPSIDREAATRRAREDVEAFLGNPSAAAAKAVVDGWRDAGVVAIPDAVVDALFAAASTRVRTVPSDPYRTLAGLAVDTRDRETSSMTARDACRAQGGFRTTPTTGPETSGRARRRRGSPTSRSPQTPRGVPTRVPMRGRVLARV